MGRRARSSCEAGHIPWEERNFLPLNCCQMERFPFRREAAPTFKRSGTAALRRQRIYTFLATQRAGLSKETGSPAVVPYKTPALQPPAPRDDSALRQSSSVSPCGDRNKTLRRKNTLSPQSHLSGNPKNAASDARQIQGLRGVVERFSLGRRRHRQRAPARFSSTASSPVSYASSRSEWPPKKAPSMKIRGTVRAPVISWRMS